MNKKLDALIGQKAAEKKRQRLGTNNIPTTSMGPDKR
jgi:hypothetical protein